MTSNVLTDQDVLDELSDLVDVSLANSAFWSSLSRGEMPLPQIRFVFEQYYLWRNAFHRWFGVCIAKSPAFGTSSPTEFILRELVEHIEEEIDGDHHGMCQVFMKAIGVTDLRAIKPLPVTTDYIEYFSRRYLPLDTPGDEALAALAARELVAPARNRIAIDAFEQHYGVADGLQFFSLHEELEIEHFRGLWEAVARSRPEEVGRLLRAARDEITRHVRFWDDVAEQYPKGAGK